VNRKILAITVILIVVIAVIAAWQVPPLLTGNNNNTNTPEFSLTLKGAGCEEKILNQIDFAELTPTIGKGGFKTSGGVISEVSTFTGVSVLSLCDLVGGMPSDATLTVTASDGYSMVYTYNQVNGNGFTTYDPVTGSEKAATQPLTLVVNYLHNDTAFSSNHGPLRMGIVGSEGLLTEGNLWVKKVAQIEITPNLKDWSVTVEATSTLNMDCQSFTAEINHYSINYTDSTGNIWTGTALWRWVSWSNYNGGVTNGTLNKGYKVRIVSGDGSSVTFDDSEIKLNEDIIVAARLNGSVLTAPYWPLTMVGPDVSSAKSIQNIIKIQIIIDAQATATPAPTATPSPTNNPTATPTVSPAPSPSPTPSPSPIPVPGIQLTLVAANGTQLILTPSDLAKYPAITANGGTRSSTGTLANYGAYTGIAINTLLNLVGGVTSANTVRITASDAYVSNYTYQQINGQGIATYDAQGNTATPTQSITMIVAWYLNGTALASNSGPLRTMYVGADGLYSTGSMNAKMVVKIEVV
jgi:hypothetical protein